jgi:transcriptional regulator with XRE-family HTH domain
METQEFETVSERLKKIRLENNISQDFLAKKLGYTQKAYSKIENNETKLNVDVLKRISEILNVPIESFFSKSQQLILNDFSNRTGGDNIIYKNNLTEKMEELFKEIIKSKDEVIASKINEIETLRMVINKLG